MPSGAPRNIKLWILLFCIKLSVCVKMSLCPLGHQKTWPEVLNPKIFRSQWYMTMKNIKYAQWAAQTQKCLKKYVKKASFINIGSFYFKLQSTVNCVIANFLFTIKKTDGQIYLVVWYKTDISSKLWPVKSWTRWIFLILRDWSRVILSSSLVEYVLFYFILLINLVFIPQIGCCEFDIFVI